MPKIQRSDLPEQVFRHLALRRAERGITSVDLVQLAYWLDKNPTVPDADWFKRFPGFVLVGKGALGLSFLEANQTATGTEVF